MKIICYKSIRTFLVVIFSILLFYPFTVPAQVPQVNEWRILSAIDTNLLYFQAKSVNVNPIDGAIGINKQNYRSVGIQRRSSEIYTYAVITKNVKLLETAIKILEYAFAHQNPDGSFQDYTPKISAGGKASNVAFLFYDFGHTLLLLQDSEWFQKSNDTATLRARLHKLTHLANNSLTWLIKQEAELRKNDEKTTNRLLFDASAYYLMGKALNRSDAVKIGEGFIKTALQKQTKSGIFLEKGGYDSSYQGVSLRVALVLYCNLKHNEIPLREKLWKGIEKGINRQMPQILPSGEVITRGNTRVYASGETYLGKRKKLDYLNLVFALNYYSQITNNFLTKKTMRTTSERVFMYYRGNPSFKK